jgi:hypothetical protein
LHAAGFVHNNIQPGSTLYQQKTKVIAEKLYLLGLANVLSWNNGLRGKWLCAPHLLNRKKWEGQWT